MKFKNVLIVVKDIEKSKQFYHDLFGLNTVLDSDENVILTEGLVLQDEKAWKLEQLYPAVKYVNRLAAYNWGQKMVRFYDLDGNLIEVRTPRQSRNESQNMECQGSSPVGVIMLFLMVRVSPKGAELCSPFNFLQESCQILSYLLVARRTSDSPGFSRSRSDPE